ncbi:SICA antigen [Plasmodium coatneyi]|uniref:SICA antigen n=1 Tax=Plasmodium coatneyi TaxID=208452 RepID=A0A1B1E5N7_9APIC|nr:SICA antigen [Plasmodium coatneyi]ANQ10352.1 SICA antigen [Plasmodium coatneyi]
MKEKKKGRKKRKSRHKRAHQGPLPSLEEQLFDHVDDKADGPHAYTLVKERRQQRSAPTRTKRTKKQGVGHRVCHRTIIDIHLEVLDECQKGDTKLVQEDFFEILVQEFMGSDFIKEKKIQSSNSGFREEDLCS